MYKYICAEAFSQPEQSNPEYFTLGKESRHLWLVPPAFGWEPNTAAQAQAVPGWMLTWAEAVGCSPCLPATLWACLPTSFSLHTLSEPLGQQVSSKPAPNQAAAAAGMHVHSLVAVPAKHSSCWHLPPWAVSAPQIPVPGHSQNPTPPWAGLYRLQAAAGRVEEWWHGGSLVLLILANCVSWHGAMGDVRRWLGMEQLRVELSLPLVSFHQDWA